MRERAAALGCRSLLGMFLPERFIDVFCFELRYQVRSPNFALTCVVFMVLGFAAGAVPDSPFVYGFRATHVNAPIVVVGYIGLMGWSMVPFAVSLAAEPVLRDERSGLRDFMASLPVPWLTVLFGRTLAALTIGALPLVMAIVGSWLGTQMPWVPSRAVGAFALNAYFFGCLILWLPNTLVIVAVEMFIAEKFRTMEAVFLGVFALFVVWMVSGIIALERNEFVAALIDPFGTRAFAQSTRVLALSDVNDLLPPLSSTLLMNRAFWIFVATLLVVSRFRHFARHRTMNRPGSSLKASTQDVTTGRKLQRPLIRVNMIPAQCGGVRSSLAQLVSLVRLQWQNHAQTASFWAYCGVGMMVMPGVALQWHSITPVHPVTGWMLEILAAYINPTGLLMIVFIAGEVIFRDRESRMDSLIDVLPVSNTVRLASKIATLCLLIILLIAVSVASLLIVQGIDSTVDIQPGLWLLGSTLIALPLFGYGLIALSLHMILNNKYATYGVFMGLVILLRFPESPWPGLVSLRSVFILPSVPHSEMNGYGQLLVTWWWGLARLTGIALLAVALVLPRLVRSTAQPVRVTLAQMTRFSTRRLFAVLMLTALIVACTLALSAGSTRADALPEQDARWVGKPQPVIASIVTSVDIYPSERSAVIAGRYRIENRSAESIDVLLVRLNPRARYQLSLGGQGLPEIGNAMYQAVTLLHPLEPGASMTMVFTIHIESAAVPHSRLDEPVLADGTLLDSNAFLPQLGPSANGSVPAVRGQASSQQMAFGTGVVWLDRFDTVISTADDQIAIAPGDLVDHWRTGHRQFFRYEAGGPVLPSGAFMSGRWAARSQSAFGGTVSTVYFDPAHGFNIDRINAAISDALAYLGSEIAPYRYQSIRLAEFPRYAAYAESLPAMLPFSESYGLIGDLDRDGAVDYVSFIAAHEVAHQWWGQQVVAAQGPGASMLTESLAQYFALMVMRRSKGEAAVHRYLAQNLESYLSERAKAVSTEEPLSRVGQERFVYYDKGALVFYRIAEEIGEENLDRVLRGFFLEHSGRGPPYPSASDLSGAILQSCPLEKRRLVDQLLNQVVLYDNRIESAVARLRPDGRWQVSVSLSASKSRTEEDGSTTAMAYDEPIAVSMVDVSDYEAREISRLEVVPVNGHAIAEFTLRQLPDMAGIDFDHRLIDRELAAERARVVVER